LARALAGMAEDAVLMLEGAPIVRGRAAAERLLAAQTALREARVSWEPFRVLVSSDGSLGVTFGGTVAERPGGGSTPNPGRYFTVWRRSAAGAWQVAAHQQVGLLQPGEVVLPPGVAAVPAEPDANPFAQADLAFAKLAADSGAPAAFARFVAPDGMTLAGTGELNIGPAAVRARLAQSPAATARWAWRPLITFAAASGDLGVTIGEATIQRTDVEPNATSYSKYLTVWQRQPVGSLKFVVDGGSGRPPPR
jgi:ketosteroid isomerase-like protein